MSEDALVIVERVLERVVIADEVLVVHGVASTGPAGLTGPPGPQGVPGSAATIDAHLDDTTPHPVYDDGPSLVLLYENAKV